ncbi:MAG: 4-hydroxy-tetrahydrodipicolinate reductase [Spirosomataceae bacterium]
MRIVLLGYGKMGKIIERFAQERGHEIVARIDVYNHHVLTGFSPDDLDVVIEFSHPSAAFNNLKTCMEKGFRVVCGTTGWLEQRPKIEELCQQHNAAFFYASNYSIGVNLFFQLNKQLAKLISPYSQYEVNTIEIHHTEKKDAPSGTAITLAEGIIQHLENKESWVNNTIAAANEVPIWSVREGKVPGTHTIKYISNVDTIEITHTAHNREGFALGAVVAAEWLVGKTGIFGMDDLFRSE